MKPERRARYFPTRQDAARLWLECGGTDFSRDQGLEDQGLEDQGLEDQGLKIGDGEPQAGAGDSN